MTSYKMQNNNKWITREFESTETEHVWELGSDQSEEIGL